jgi:hypothetical protein
MYGIAAAPSGYATCMQNMHMTCHAACVLCTKCQPNAEAAARLAPGRAGAFRREAALQGTHHSQHKKCITKCTAQLPPAASWKSSNVHPNALSHHTWLVPVMTTPFAGCMDQTPNLHVIYTLAASLAARASCLHQCQRRYYMPPAHTLCWRADPSEHA